MTRSRTALLVLCAMLASCGPRFHVPPMTEKERQLLPDFSSLRADEVTAKIAETLRHVRDVEAVIPAKTTVRPWTMPR